DDHTDVRILGAIAKLLPELFSLKSVQKAIVNEWKDPVKAESVARSCERISTTEVMPNQGNPEIPYKFEFPKWHEMGEGIAIPSIPAGRAVEDPVSHATGGCRAERNLNSKKCNRLTVRQVLNVETCTSDAVCVLQCPDSCFD